MNTQEIVEAEGHLIDSHIMETHLRHGRRIPRPLRSGGVPHRPHQQRRLLPAPEGGSPRRRSHGPHPARKLLGLGCAPVDAGDADLRPVERDRCAPEDFYSTTNHRTCVRHGQQWIEVENQRMDAMIVVDDGRRLLPPPARLCAGRPRRGRACAASASSPNRRSATASPSPS